MNKKAMNKYMPLLALTIVFTIASSAWGGTLDDVTNRGLLKCGVSEGVLGFSSPNASGVWEGLDVDVCRAVSAAIFGNPNQVEYVPLTGGDRFNALNSGRIDMLSRVTTRTLSRDAKLNLTFAPVTFYDGQGFLVHKGAAKSVADLNGARICVLEGTTTINNLVSYFAAREMNLKTFSSSVRNEVIQAFMNKDCVAFTSDSSDLASVRAGAGEAGKAYDILPEIISKEPLAPVVREGDDQWADIVTWSVYALIAAEELNITSSNIEQMLLSPVSTSAHYLLGSEGNNGELLGLSNKWSYDIISTVGNYGEIFDRHVGTGSIIGLERGLNGLWTNGGLMYAPPLH